MAGLATPITFSYRSAPYFSDETATSNAAFLPYIQRAAGLGVFGAPAASADGGSSRFCATNDTTNNTTRSRALPYITGAFRAI
jgi:hypothetical protein